MIDRGKIEAAITRIVEARKRREEAMDAIRIYEEEIKELIVQEKIADQDLRDAETQYRDLMYGLIPREGDE